MHQLDDVAAVEDDVISAGHAALHHDSVPAGHLKGKKMGKNLTKWNCVKINNKKNNIFIYREKN